MSRIGHRGFRQIGGHRLGLGRVLSQNFQAKSSHTRNDGKRKSPKSVRQLSNVAHVSEKVDPSHFRSHAHRKSQSRTRNHHQKSPRPRRRPVRKGRQVDPVKAGVDFSLAVFDPEVGKMCVTKEEEVASTERQRVLECTHKSVEKCHYTYVTQFKPSQEEVCEENFEKSCQITFKQQAYNETVRKCYRPTSKVCNGEGPEECRTVYESSCTTKYVEKQPGKFVGDTGCEKLPVEICGAGCTFEEGEEECHDKVLTSVVDLPEEVCDLNPQKTCKFITKLVPQLKPIHQCTIVPQEVCQMKFSSPQQIKKPLITKWCLDETPPQPGELYPAEEERSSGGENEGGIGPVFLDEDFLDFESGQDNNEHHTPEVDNHPKDLLVEQHDTMLMNQKAQSSPGSIGNVDFADGILVEFDEDVIGEGTELPLLDLELSVPEFDLPHRTFEAPIVSLEISPEKDDIIKTDLERDDEEEDMSNIITDDIDYGEKGELDDDTLTSSGDDEEFLTFVDETFPEDDFENYEDFY